MNKERACVLVSEEMKFVLNVFVHSLIIFTFLTLFFMLYVRKLMKGAFENEIGSLIKDNLGGTVDLMDEASKKKLGMLLKYINVDKFIEMYKKPSDYVEEYNKWIERGAIGIVIFSVILLTVIVVILYYNCGKCVPLWEIFKENLIIFVFVGIVEYLFFTNIALKFIPAPPSLLTKTVIDKIKTTIVE